MKKFTVIISESLERVLTIEAETIEAATEYAEKLHRDEEIILDSSDFTGAEFTPDGEAEEDAEVDYSTEGEA